MKAVRPWRMSVHDGCPSLTSARPLSVTGQEGRQPTHRLLALYSTGPDTEKGDKGTMCPGNLSRPNMSGDGTLTP